MSSATFTPTAAAPRGTPQSGATAATGAHHPHPVGNALRAVKVFVETAFGVVVMGEYGSEAGVRRR